MRGARLRRFTKASLRIVAVAKPVRTGSRLESVRYSAACFLPFSTSSMPACARMQVSTGFIQYGAENLAHWSFPRAALQLLENRVEEHQGNAIFGGGRFGG